MRVLLTGIEGFTGPYVKDELVRHGHTVVGLQSDLMDFNAISDEIAKVQPEAVLHLAGISFVNDPDTTTIYQVNLIGTRHLLAALAAKAPHVRQVILASTANVYGNSSVSILTETTPAHPANDYAVSKLAMEYMAALWFDKLPICIVRPFNYTGAGQSERFLIPKIVSHFIKKKPFIELGNLDVEREFGDVRSVANVYRLLLEKNVTGKTLNVCTGKVYTLQEVIALCEKMTQHHIEVKVNPQFVRANEVRSMVGSAEQLKSVIGAWHQYAFEDTLQWMLGS